MTGGGPGNTLRAVFLDRDGTIIVDRNYLSDPAGVEFLPGAIEGMRRLSKLGLALVVVSNQSGVGRGYYTLADMNAVMEKFTGDLREAGVIIDGVYTCPHAPEEHCRCRKPATGMALDAAKDLKIRSKGGYMIGDKASDIRFGKAIECRTVLIGTAPSGAGEDKIAGDLAQAAQWIEEMEKNA